MWISSEVWLHVAEHKSTQLSITTNEFWNDSQQGMQINV